MTTSFYDAHIERIAAGERLSPDEIRALARTPDILPLGMLADAVRKRLHGSRVTFLRVASCAFDQSIADAVPPAARELRLTGSPDSLDAAVTAVQAARSVAGLRTVAAFTWADAERWRAGELDALEDRTLTINLYFRNELLPMLDRAGFADVKVEGDHNHLPATAEDEFLVFLARKDP